MSRSRSEHRAHSAAIGLSTTGAAWHDINSAMAWSVVDFGESSSDTGPAAKQWVDQICERQGSANRQALTWVLGHSLMPHWIQHVPQGIQSLGELQSLAEARARFLFGPTNGGNPWRVHGDWRSDRPFLCSALPANWAQALGENAHLATPLLMGTAALESSLAQPGWTLISTPFEAHILYRSQSNWSQLRTLRLPHSLSSTDLEQFVHAEWRRETMRSSAPEGDLDWLHFGPGPDKPLLESVKWANPAWQRHLSQSASQQATTVFESDLTCNVWAYEQVMAKGLD